MKGRVILLLIVATLLMATIALIVAYNKPHRSIADDRAAFKVSAAQIVEAFSEDEVRAGLRYTGKVIEVTGPLNELSGNDSTLILLIGNDAEMMGVSCFMETTEMTASAGLTPGEIVTVKGICNGVLIDVVLDKGVLVMQ